MPPHLSRRALFHATAIAAATSTLSLTAIGRAAAATLPAPSAWTVRPFQHREVSLGQGICATNRQLMLDYARGYDVDRPLQVFRVNAGLSTGGAVGPGGWKGPNGTAAHLR
jgi:uncharacterized protein